MSYEWLAIKDQGAMAMDCDMAQLADFGGETEKREGTALRGILFALPIGIAAWALLLLPFL
ncbi:hypothetical protein [Stakelama tenebrarum]|uniref:Uncharacterized protein n=1 Tax=Stakelama tenebrarum TaxID=2711215 RepID=A0A6G6Y397_9SPHN|nr:hypothetical protein [Sphingosinithalassobacter tenebrarum]QIG79321.1 hypothetical protein G5C33_05620 [Sphingosinithalassobacter tenebrarum]